MNDMTKLKDMSFIKAYDDIASEDYCRRMIEKWDYLFQSSSSNCIHSSDNYDAGERKDYSFGFDQARNQAEGLVAETFQILNIGLRRYEEDYPSLPMKSYYSNNIKVQKTPTKGGFHRFHSEHGVGDASTRTLTWTIYLNDMPEGEAETEFLEYGTKIHPKAGRVCFFPASWTHTHRGNPVYTQSKYIATGWYHFLEGE